MFKLLPTVLLATTMLLGYTGRLNPALAGTCAGSSCPPPPLEFIPGQRINVEVVNRTGNTVLFEKVEGTDAIALQPGQWLRFERWTGTEPNLSMVFWHPTALLLKAQISQPNPDTLRLELRPGERPPGDRSVYIFNDGRVAVF